MRFMSRSWPVLEVDPTKHDECEFIGVLFDQIFDVFGAKQILARSWGAQQQGFFGIDAARLQVGLDRVGVRRERAVLDQDLVSSSIRSVEADHQKMKIHRERVHHHDLAGQGAHQSRSRLPESFVVVEPWPGRFEVSFDAESSPVIEFFLHPRTDAAWHQAQ